MDTLWQDFRYGVRVLVKSPGFTAIAVLTLALGIGANTAIFRVVNAVLLQPLPYDHPERLVDAFETEHGARHMALSRLDFQDWRAQGHSFAQLAAYYYGRADLVGAGEPETVTAAWVTDGFFDAFGVSPLLGHAFGAAGAGDLSQPVAVISERLWRSRFGSRPDILGQTIRLEGKAYAIVAVMSARLDFPHETQVWLPLDLSTDDSSRSAHNYRIVGRLKPGVTFAAAQAELGAIAARLAAAYPDSNLNVGGKLMLLQDTMTQNVRATLFLLWAMVGLVLLIACANVANLLLVRAGRRRGEIAMRAALGAGPSRIVRQLLTEGVVLALAGGATGFLLSLWTSRALAAWVPPGLLPVAAPATGLPDLGFSLGLAFLTVLLFGLAPALHSARGDLVEALKRAPGRGVAGERLRGVLITSEVAFSVLLLIGAGLTARSLLRLESQRLGFDPNHLLVADVSFGSASGRLSHANNSRWLQDYMQLMEALRHLPGVESVAASDTVPFTGGGPNGGILVEGRPPEHEAVWPAWRVVSEDFFRTMRIPLLRGRSFEPSDSNAVPAVVINDSMAKDFWPGADPLGQRIAIPGLDEETYHHFLAGKNNWFTVIGIVGDIRDESLGLSPAPALYVFYSQNPALQTDLSVVLRTALPLRSLEAAIRKEVRDVNPDVPLRLRTLDDVMLRSVATPRLRSLLIGLFAFLALALASVGVYGVTSYLVEQRTAEIGIRMALGAQPGDILRLVLGQSARWVFFGLAAGIAGALVLARLIASLLFGVSAADPATYAGVALVLASVALLACYLPARRAMRVDPMVVLRYE